ncbi:hypothetical protein EON65_11245 [archaeon]|nr:MAG: hypothetical protein EON65_11245 [archaeon]
MSVYLYLYNPAYASKYHTNTYPCLPYTPSQPGTLTQSKADKYHAYALATGAATRDIPSDELKSILETLCADTKNVVFVVSGRFCIGIYGDIYYCIFCTLTYTTHTHNMLIHKCINTYMHAHIHTLRQGVAHSERLLRVVQGPGHRGGARLLLQVA